MSCENMNCPLDHIQEADENSLYNQRIYDQHANNTRCYESNPQEIIEKFDTSFTMRNIIKWILVLLIVALLCYAGYTIYKRQGNVVKVNYNAGTTVGSMSPPL